MQTLDKNILASIHKLGIDEHLPDNWLEGRENLFSTAMVPLSDSQVSDINTVIATIEEVVKLPSYQEKVLSWAPETAQFDSGVPGVFFGYDFHLSAEGPKLIEINSNAGSAALTAILATAQGEEKLSITEQGDWKAYFTQMFQAEWEIKRDQQPLTSVAIVDEDPADQYLYPDFLLFQAALENQGIKTIIVDPKEFTLKDGRLYHQDIVIDLVYNRLTDFSLEMPENNVLKEAYEAEAVVLTPHPRAHALYADKRNLSVLTDIDLLSSWGVREEQLNILSRHIPKVDIVDPNYADMLWETRKQLFFKPVAGYGGKGSYRGHKMSRKVFSEIMQAQYVAQTLTPPSELVAEVEDEPQTFRIDIRSYVYQANPIGMVARLYQGQVTNMRTKGGGFAAVMLEA